MNKMVRLVLGVALVCSMGFLVACGGGGGGGGTAANPAAAPASTYTVSGQVQGDGTGAGIPVLLIKKDSLYLAPEVRGSVPETVPETFYTTQTGPGGVFTLTGVVGGEYTLTVTQSRSVAAIRQGLSVNANVASLTLYLTATGDIAGTIAITNDYKPLGAYAFVPGTSYSAFADASGAFKITGVPVGTYNVAFGGPGLDQSIKEAVVVTAGTVTSLPLVSLGVMSVGAPDLTYVLPFGGKVRFNHSSHVGQYRLQCATCHTNNDPFEKKLNVGSYTMADMYAGKGCGMCHNGQPDKAFDLSLKNTKNCKRCHFDTHDAVAPNIVGQGQCAGCHPKVVKQFETPLRYLDGSRHTYIAHDFDFINLYSSSSSCGECHHHEAVFGKAEATSGNVHNGISCQTCHFPTDAQHRSAGVNTPYRLRKGYTELCATCHHTRNNYSPEFPYVVGYNANAASSAIPLWLMNIPYTNNYISGVANGGDVSLICSTTAAIVAANPKHVASISAQLNRYPHESAQYDVYMGPESAMFFKPYKDLTGAVLTYGDTKHRQFPQGCAMCHLGGRDPSKDEWGHTFAASTAACLPCHPTMDIPARMHTNELLLEELGKKLDVNGDGAIEWVVRTTRNDWNAANADVRLTAGHKLVLIGAGWNYHVLHADISEGIHNYRFVKSLLENTIKVVDQIKAAAGITAAPGAAW